MGFLKFLLSSLKPITFFPSLLNYDWQIKIVYISGIECDVSMHVCAVWSDYHNQANTFIASQNTFYCVWSEYWRFLLLANYKYKWCLNNISVKGAYTCEVKNPHINFDYSCPSVSGELVTESEDAGFKKDVEQYIQLALCVCRFPTMDQKYCFQSMVAWQGGCKTQG